MREGKKPSASEEVAARSLYIFIFSLVIMGLSAYVISKHEGARAIMIVHLVLVLNKSSHLLFQTSTIDASTY
jgi:hypothetical protein